MVKRAAGVLLFACLLAGCQAIPTTGPVEKVNPTTSSATYEKVEILPAPPAEGSSPAGILAGFLTAMASDGPEYASAKLYLSSAAKTTWDPSRGITIYDGENHPPLISDSSAMIVAPNTGMVSKSGRYTPTYQGKYQHDFKLVQEDGQWRISSPPEGLLISEYLFNRRYQLAPIYFLNQTRNKIVPELLYLTEEETTPTSVITGLLEGPSTWLSQAVTTVIPADTRLAIPAVTVDQQGIANIPLTEEVSGLSDDERLLLAAQIHYSLERFDHIIGFKITVNGVPFAVPGARHDGVVTGNGLDQLTSLPHSADHTVYISRDNQLLMLTGGYTDPVVPISDTLGAQPGAEGIGGFKVFPEKNQIYYTNIERTKIYRSDIYVGESPELEVLSGEQLTDPFECERQVCAIGSVNSTPTLFRGLDTPEIKQIPIEELSGWTLSSASLSSSGSLLAAVGVKDGNSHLGLLRVSFADQGRVDGWRELPLNTSKGQVKSFSSAKWSSDATLVVLGSTSVDSTMKMSIYQATIDGSQVKSLGPATSLPPAKIAVFPTKSGGISPNVYFIDASGQLFELVGSSRWDIIATGVANIDLSIG